MQDSTVPAPRQSGPRTAAPPLCQPKPDIGTALPPIFTTTLGQVVSSAMPALSLGEYVIAFPAVRPEAERSNGVIQNISEAYINATRRHAAQVRLGDDGELHGYIAGQPFPVLDPADREFGNYEVLAQGIYRPRPKANRWGQDGVLQKEFFHILPLFDLKNTMSLKHRHARDADRWIPA